MRLLYKGEGLEGIETGYVYHVIAVSGDFLINLAYHSKGIVYKAGYSDLADIFKDWLPVPYNLIDPNEENEPDVFKPSHNAIDITFEEVMVCGQQALWTSKVLRVDTIPKGYYVYYVISDGTPLNRPSCLSNGRIAKDRHMATIIAHQEIRLLHQLPSGDRILNVDEKWFDFGFPPCRLVDYIQRYPIPMEREREREKERAKERKRSRGFER